MCTNLQHFGAAFRVALVDPTAAASAHTSTAEPPTADEKMLIFGNMVLTSANKRKH
jgi:hypothetical protein